MTNLAEPSTRDELTATNALFAEPAAPPAGSPFPPPSGRPFAPTPAATAPAPASIPTPSPAVVPSPAPATHQAPAAVVAAPVATPDAALVAAAPAAATALSPATAPNVLQAHPAAAAAAAAPAPAPATAPPPTTFTPTIPTVTPVKSTARQPTSPPQSSGIPDFSALTTATSPQKRRKGGFGRFIKFVFTLALLGAIAGAAVVYGPELRERFLGDETETGLPAVPETEAPLRFPTTALVNPPQIRTATFLLSDLGDEATRSYQITTDFETRVARVLIDRNELPTLEVLTFLDQAVVRRVGDDVWYRTPRGRFPLDDQLDRNRWVRHLDELIPATSRPSATIEESAMTTLSGEQVQRILLSIDATLLAGPEITKGTFGAPDADELPLDAETSGPALSDDSILGEARATVDAVNDQTDQIDPATGQLIDPATGQPIDPATGQPIDPATPPPSDVVGDQASAPAPPPPGGPATGSEPISIELWVDSSGVIRQMVAPDALGGETLTVTSFTSDAWLPEFPLEEQVEPLTASALVELGL